MQASIRVLRQRVRDSRYAIDERAVAEAVLTRLRRRTAADRAAKRRHVAWLVIEFLAKHPQSTVGDLSKSLNLDPGRVFAHLTQLIKAGEITKHAHGYSIKQTTRRRRSQHPRAPRLSH